MLARVFPLGRSAAGEQTETVIAKFQTPRGTLVVVDDHARFREAVGERLAAAGWRIVGEAATGAAAIDLVTRLAPDVVLLDVVLTSGHDRGDFAGRIRSAPVRGFLPKEMISGPALATLLAGDQP